MELVPSRITSNPIKLVSPARWGCVDGCRGTLSLSTSILRVAGDSGTITLRCKDLRVLQLDIEGVEATLDIARSIEVRQGCTRGP